MRWCLRRAATRTCTTCRPTRRAATSPPSGAPTSVVPRSRTPISPRSTPPAFRNAGGVDLGETGVRERGTTLVGAPDGGDVAALRVGRQVVHVRVAARRKHHRIARVRAHRPGDQVAHDDAAGPALDHHEVEHLGAGMHVHHADPDLPRQGLIGTQQQLLAGLAARVEGARNLYPPKGAVCEQPPVLAREGDALGRALVDDAGADLREAIHVGLAGAEVAALDRVVEQPEDRVAVVLVVLGGVDSTLRGDRVRPPRRILEAEAGHPVAELGERRGRGGARQPGADHNDVMLQLVRRVDELDLRAVPFPFRRERSVGGAGAQLHGHRSTPASTATGMEMYPPAISTAMAAAAPRRQRPVGGGLSPSVCSALHVPWYRCSPSTTIAAMYAAATGHTRRLATTLWYTSPGTKLGFTRPNVRSSR